MKQNAALLIDALSSSSTFYYMEITGSQQSKVQWRQAELSLNHSNHLVTTDRRLHTTLTYFTF